MNASLDILRHMNSQVWKWKPPLPVPQRNLPHPFHVRLLPEDTNQETLIRLLEPIDTVLPLADGRVQPIFVESTGLLALDELATFLGRDAWNIQKRIPWLTRIYSDKDYIYHTQKGGRIHLIDCALSLMGCCTTDWLREAITPLLFGGGFMDRTLLIYREPLPPPGLFPTPRPRDPVAAAKLAHFLVDLTHRQRREELLATPHANEYYEQWYHNQEDSPDPQETSVKRKANHLWKLAAVLAISDGTAPYIHSRHFALADTIFSAEWRYHRMLLNELDAAPEFKQMGYIESILHHKGAVEGQDPGYITRRDLFAILRSRKGLSPPTIRATPILDTMEASGRINKIDKGGPAGRNREAYQLTARAAAEHGPVPRRRRGAPKLRSVKDPTPEQDTPAPKKTTAKPGDSTD
jgi:hypothetical protein